MADVEILLARLDGVIKIPAKRHAESYKSLCPSHDDRHPSLCVDVTRDNRILLFCRSGCSATEVLRAIGLSLTDLFPKNDCKLPIGPSIRDIEHAHSIAAIANADLEQGKVHSPRDIVAIKRSISVLMEAWGLSCN